MLKSNFKIIVFLFIIIFTITFTCSTVLAENVLRDEENASIPSEGVLISEDPLSNVEDQKNDGNSDVASNPDSSKGEDVYLTGSDVIIDYVVDGNLFVIANTVTINSQIAGDAFICANTVTIGDQGYIFSNLFSLSKTLNINGIVYDLYSACETLNMNGYIYRNLHVASNNVTIAGTVRRNASIGCNTLTFAQNTTTREDGQNVVTSANGKIVGNLNYSSTQEASIPDGAVEGSVVFDKKSEKVDNSSFIEDKIYELGTFVVTVALIWLLSLWLAPKFFDNKKDLLMTKKILPVIGLGLVTPIALTLLFFLLLVLGLTSTISFLVLLSFIILMAISTSIFVITINTIVCDKLKIEKDKKLITFGILVVTSIVLWIIGLIPIIGGILNFIYIVLGLGIIIYSLFKKDTSLSEKQK